jgi:hypothetical protein
MSLRLQIANNIVRLASYHNGEFKEGVSLTIYDELARWEKYITPLFNMAYKEYTLIPFIDTHMDVTNWFLILSTLGYGEDPSQNYSENS